MSAGACQRGLMWKRLFTDVIKLRVSRRAQSEDDLGGPETRRQVSSREKRGNAQRRPRETEAEVGVTQPHAEGRRGRQELEGQGGPSPRPSGGARPRPPLDFRCWPPHWERIHFCWSRPPTLVICYGDPGRRRQRPHWSSSGGAGSAEGAPRGVGPGRAGPHPRAWRCW